MVEQKYHIKMNLKLDECDAHLYNKLGGSIFGLLASVDYASVFVSGNQTPPTPQGILDIKVDQCNSNLFHFTLEVNVPDQLNSVPEYQPRPEPEPADCCNDCTDNLCEIKFGSEDPECNSLPVSLVRKYVLYINALYSIKQHFILELQFSV